MLKVFRPSGSTGRGEAYGTAIEADWGHKEVIDQLACVDAAIATGSIDSNKLGIGGWSVDDAI